MQNAIIDALAPIGVRHIDIPASPQRVDLRTERYRHAIQQWLPAGMEGARRALENRSLTGARGIAAVVDARIRRNVGAHAP